MKAIILDTETTGLSAPHATEIAWIEIDTNFMATGSSFSQRFNPLKPIESGASRVTGIHDNDVKDAPPHTTFRLPKIDYLIGHNIRYDMGVLQNAGVDLSRIKPICTCNLARKYFGELSKFSLGALLIHFYPDDQFNYQNNAHGAYHDVLFTHKVLTALNQRIGAADFEALFLSSLPTKMPFGKHKGKAFDAIPDQYKQWLLTIDIDMALKTALLQSMSI
ncbi:3'-5' exonuclease [Moraxella oculi]|uniref:3'-5' exonuclease n=1 Tax=Moraxella oculi TaxID=2940516 RepID=A0ABW8U6L3_9GAMM